MSVFDFFLKLSLFKGVSPESLYSLIPRITLDFETFQAGTVVFDRQTEAKGVVYLLNGRMIGTCDDCTTVFTGGNLLAFSGLFGSENACLMDMQALEESRILVIDTKSLIYLIQNNTIILENYLNWLADSADAGRCIDLLQKRSKNNLY
ncbi:MAG: cyclic nucleotide-binding domain-containing protein [Bacteroidota bacterium]|nr:cyclic nucleotide-binding domain-containing protein [Bacteroidota bacterium]